MSIREGCREAGAPAAHCRNHRLEESQEEGTVPRTWARDPFPDVGTRSGADCAGEPNAAFMALVELEPLLTRRDLILDPTKTA